MDLLLMLIGVKNMDIKYFIIMLPFIFGCASNPKNRCYSVIIYENKVENRVEDTNCDLYYYNLNLRDLKRQKLFNR